MRHRVAKPGVATQRVENETYAILTAREAPCCAAASIDTTDA